MLKRKIIKIEEKVKIIMYFFSAYSYIKYMIVKKK